METGVSSSSREVVIAPNNPTVLIGERINPTGKKKMTEALKAGDLETIQREAVAQVEAGADIIDINVGVSGVDEILMLPQAVKAVMEVVDTPLCLDSTNPEALRAALEIYKGKPVINSISGEEQSLATILPLVKEYGTAVVALLQDDNGIPIDAERKIAIAHKIVSRVEALGISRDKLLIDCLAMAIAVNTSSSLVFMETVRRIRSELGVNLTVGASNVSFGLPERELVNNTFAAVAIANGVNSLITDVAKVRATVLATDLVLGRDTYARRYISAYRQRQKSGK